VDAKREADQCRPLALRRPRRSGGPETATVQAAQLTAPKFPRTVRTKPGKTWDRSTIGGDGPPEPVGPPRRAAAQGRVSREQRVSTSRIGSCGSRGATAG